MRKEARLIKAFGINETGQANLPLKISGTFVSRVIWGDDSGCTYCFPRGPETYNSRYNNTQRCWKKHRKTQWKYTN